MNDSTDKTVEERISLVIKKEKSAVESGDTEKYFSVLSEDAVFMPPNSMPKEGQILRDWLKEFVESAVIVWEKFESVEVVIEDNLAYHIFNYVWRVTPRDGRQAIKGQGKGMHILKLMEGGDWKISREIWNSNPPAEG